MFASSIMRRIEILVPPKFEMQNIPFVFCVGNNDLYFQRACRLNFGSRSSSRPVFSASGPLIWAMCIVSLFMSFHRPTYPRFARSTYTAESVHEFTT